MKKKPKQNNYLDFADENDFINAVNLFNSIPEEYLIKMNQSALNQLCVLFSLDIQTMKEQNYLYVN